MIEIIKKYKLVFIALIAYIITGLSNINIFFEAINNTWVYIKEMLQILPAVFVLAALVNSWVPAEVILNNFGKKSGLKGKFMSVFIGSISAGPIYAAFPLTQSLLKKGASLSNTVIIISSWAVVKVPMLIVESKFLGIDFALTRYLLTVPGIILIGILCEKILHRKKVIFKATTPENSKITKINDLLPGHNCGSCGYNSCMDYARAIVEGKAEIDRCIPGDKVDEINNLLEKENIYTQN